MTARRRLIYQLNLARHTMMKAMNARCRSELGVSVSQLSALMVLDEQPGCVMKDLATVLMLDKSAVTGLAGRMADNGLIAKEPCSDDSRVTRLRMTDQGRAVLTDGMRLLHEANRLMTSGFSERELSIVARYLDHLTTVFSTQGGVG